jgi:hypothetical protein
LIVGVGWGQFVDGCIITEEDSNDDDGCNLPEDREYDEEE